MNPDSTQQAADFLFELLARQIDARAQDWLQARAVEFREAGPDRVLYLAFSAAPRYLGKAALEVNAADFLRAHELRPDFSPAGWTLDRAARIWLLLQWPAADPERFEQQMTTLFEHADLGELVALYSSLPLLPHPGHFVARASEGVRTNITSVFDAVALDNPYPADYLQEPAWNQLVMKTAFLDRPLYRIVGLDRRANVALSRIITDYVHERWAAGRVVSPELWRPMSPFIQDAHLPDLQRLFHDEHPLQRAAAALACSGSSSAAAQHLLEQHPDLESRVKAGDLHWNVLSLEWWQEKEKAAV